MIKVLIRGNQVMLPTELRAVLTLLENDAIEVQEVDEGLLLKRSASARRAAALTDIRSAQAGVGYCGRELRPAAAEEEQIGDLLAADKADDRTRSSQ